jgi:hypothetical protein
MYPQDDGNAKIASQSVEEAVKVLAHLKAQIKALEAQEEQYQTLIQGYMADKAVLSSVDGSILATWKNAKGSKKFSTDLFQKAMPDIYKQFVVEVPGSRRFLVK